MIDTTELRAALAGVFGHVSYMATHFQDDARYDWRLAASELYRIRSSLEIIEEILNG